MIRRKGTAVAEISRNLDQALDHQKEHLKTMRADLHANKAAMLKQIDVHRSSLKDAVRALEKEVGEYTLNWKRIAADSAEILMRLDHELLLSETSGD
jgi:exonuclease III